MQISRLLGNDPALQVHSAVLLKKLSDCAIPGDKRKILEFLETLDFQLERRPKNTAREIDKNQGVQLLFRLIKEMKTCEIHYLLMCNLFSIIIVAYEL